jgi:hypothetical protein
MRSLGFWALLLIVYGDDQAGAIDGGDGCEIEEWLRKLDQEEEVVPA